MIELIYGAHRSAFATDFEAIHRLRHRVFFERMGWEVHSADGWEMDRYDDMNPAHLIYRASNGKVGGCLRLLPTTGPNMLANTFPVLLDGAQPPAADDVWETSRFAVDMEIATERTPTGLNRATCELLAGVIEFGLAYGLKQTIAVFDLTMERVVKRAGCPTTRIGSAKRLGKCIAAAGFFDLSERALMSVRQTAGISAPVLRTYAWPQVPKAA